MVTSFSGGTIFLNVDDAVAVLYTSGLDTLVLGNIILEKVTVCGIS